MRDLKSQRMFKVGNWVQVRSREEIFRTLDANGELDGMPFMPEMLKFCGMKFRVYKRAHKTCDYSTPYPWRSRRLKDAVHLETRCSGEAHDGCQAGCLMFWKVAWLKAVDIGTDLVTPSSSMSAVSERPRSEEFHCDESVLKSRTRDVDVSDGSTFYRCQTTQLPGATSPLNWWDLTQYLQDLRSGNISIARLISGMIYSAFFHLSNAGLGVGPAMRWLYNTSCRIWGGSMYPATDGHLTKGMSTPTAALNLQPGELVKVKRHEEILDTVDSDNKNRGMYWGPELVPYCGKTYRVLGRVNRLIDERTSKMIEMKNPCIILDSVVCQARYSQCRMFCPREMYPYWREIWLERVASGEGTTDVDRIIT